MKKLLFIPLAISALCIVSCSEEKKLIRKASNAVDLYDYDKALTYYDQVLAKDSNSYYANAGKGIVLSEYMGRYDQAIPYLEKAAKKNPDKTEMKINNDLGKSYHYIGNYPRALYFYDKTSVKNTEKNPDYDIYLYKRIEDCKYALEHPSIAPPEQQSVKNVGSVINTDKPEYGPVYTNGELIFTSKRQDTPKEKKNGVDRRYWESMYVSKLDNGKFGPVRRFKRPDYGEDSNFKNKGGESVVSASPDGKTLYIFKNSQLYEAKLNDSTKNEQLMPANINISYLQTHAFVSPDNKVLFFTSTSEKGFGGMDIYRSLRGEDGRWQDPVGLPGTVNTGYNEDAPFMTEDGTLFFASNGLPGYGGYDVYKTRLVDGQWTTPENLGQPINTPGDDMYFALNPNSSKGYYSSNRPGGKGDLDIYAVHYISNDIPECKSLDTLFVINAIPNGTNSMMYNFSLQIPEQYKNNVRSVSLTVNDQNFNMASGSADYTFSSANVYKVSAKAVVYCDTCPSLSALCAEKEITVGQTLFVQTDTSSVKTNSLAIADANKTAVKDKKSAEKNKIGNYASQSKVPVGPDQLKVLGWNSTPGYFEYNKSGLTSDTKKMLDENIRVMKSNTDLVVIVNGYADSRGTEIYNKNLSAQRANSVKAYLIENGIPKYRITTVNAYGETKIENGCTDGVSCSEEQHSENRKVTFDVLSNAKMITFKD
ncbi:hypothetical protein CNR22_14165 [Sphingobacteriaceae bacterium]|nr:hypothetical protein CNR22_14165 [Sphingobacteriaceae bacterium]